MKQYLDTLRYIKDNGHDHQDRTGVGRRSVFGLQVRYDLTRGFPLVTTRKISTKALIEELLWFIRGSIDVNELNEKGVKIWDPWTLRKEHVNSIVKKFQGDIENSDSLFPEEHIDTIGPMYGYAWRFSPSQRYLDSFPEIGCHPDPLIQSQIDEKFNQIILSYERRGQVITDDKKNSLKKAVTSRFFYETTDQLSQLIINLKERPYSSRHVITAWVPEWIPFETLTPQENIAIGKGALAPCHVMQQYFVHPPKEEGGKMRLSLMMTQRSNDYPVGNPYNVAQYALLLELIAKTVNMEAYEFIHSIGDAHIYLNQLDGVEEQLEREPLQLPSLEIKEGKDVFTVTADDINIINYQHYPNIKYEVAV